MVSPELFSCLKIFHLALYAHKFCTNVPFMSYLYCLFILVEATLHKALKPQ